MEATELMEPTPEQRRVEEIGEQLRLKIAGKFQTTTFLASAALAVLAIEISLLWSDSAVSRFLPFAIGVLTGALIIFVGALLKLDALVMPKRFWPEKDSGPDGAGAQAAFLTDEDLWAIQKRMILYWTWGTVVALLLTVASLVALLWPLQAVEPGEALRVQTLAVAGSFALLAMALLGLVNGRAHRIKPPMTRPRD